MAESLWTRDLNNYGEVFCPEAFLREQCDYLSALTNNIVTARVAPFRDSYEAEAAHKNVVALMNSDPQKLLGENASVSTLTYELFITSEATPQYRFRVCFVRHKISVFPVDVIMENGIADELNEKSAVRCRSAREFEDVFRRILNSSRVTNIIKGLLVFQRRAED